MRERSGPAEKTCLLCGFPLKKTRFRRGKFCLWACGRCVFGQIFPKPSAEEVEHCYRVGYDEGSYEKVLELGRKVKRDKFKRVLRCLRQNGIIRRIKEKSVLDLGCSDGLFLELVSEMGVRDMMGVELAQQGASRAAALVGRERVYHGKVEDYALKTQRTFSLITMLDLLEHVEDLDFFMAAVTKLLRENGILVVTTPNWRSMYARFFRSRWPYFIPPEHLLYFSPRSMHSFAAKYGFDLLLTGKAVKCVSLRYFTGVAEHLAPFLAGPGRVILKCLPFGLADRSIPLYLGEIIAVFRKRAETALFQP